MNKIKCVVNSNIKPYAELEILSGYKDTTKLSLIDKF